MSEITTTLEILAIRAYGAIPVNDCDYVGEDGLLVCGKCHTPKQCKPFHGKEAVVFCLCDCMKQKDELDRMIRNRRQIERCRTDCFGTSDLMRADFAKDDGKNPKLTQTCKEFAERVKSHESPWLMLWGDCGTGKSYMAACIAHEAINAGMTARFITVPEVEQMLWRERDKSAVYDALNTVGLLVIDDFGCERRTDYMDEIKFNLIDGRLRSGKPCIITTNLTEQDFAAPSDHAMKRIISRLFERVQTCHVQGADRRFAKLRERAAEKR